MKTLFQSHPTLNNNQIQTGPLCFVLIALSAWVFFLGQANAASNLPTAAAPPSKPTEAIPWSQLGAKAGADYKGDGLAVSPTEGGVRLRCVFQRLEGEATREGLWLTSTATNGTTERFRVIAAAVGRSGLRQSSAAL